VKIAFFHHTLRLGSGIDTVIYELANRLAVHDEVTIFCFRTNYDKKDCNFQLREIRSVFANTPTKMMVLAPVIYDKIGSLREDLKKFDVINTHHYPANYIVRNLHGPLNIVTEWSEGNPSMFSSSKERLYIKLIHHTNRIAAQKADVVLAPCEFVKRWIQQNYFVDAITMFLDGINFNVFDRFHVTADRVFELYPGIEKKKIILFVGRITESKNIHSLIEAFYVVKQSLPDIILLLVGDYEHYSNYYTRLLEQVRARNLQNDVIFTGIVSWQDLPSYFAACKVYATCSLWEGFLRAEAFAFGKPIICFDAGANSETVCDDETGFLVKGVDPNKFAVRLHDLLVDEDFAQEIGQKGYLWSKENLDFDSISNRFRQFCQEHI
jgi:glycosyltransferase involved in cell wall biosynthesis